MALIYYSLAGEGRGHAARVRTIINQLLPRHRFRVFAPAAGYDFLSACQWDGDVRVEKIPGLTFRYRHGRVSKIGSLFGLAAYLRGLEGLVERLRRSIEAEEPMLAISDFEPSLPRAAERAGLPTLSIDHQQFLTTSDLTGVAWRDRMQARAVEPLVSAYVRRPYETIVSSFYFPPVREQRERVTQVGVMLRRRIRAATSSANTKGPLLVYFRRGASKAVLETLSGCGVPCRVYGFNEDATLGDVTLRRTDDEAFVDDLVDCRALLCNAGNQLVGEALYLGKRVLAIPEPGNFEQNINAHFLNASGGGKSCGFEELTSERIWRFLSVAEDSLTTPRERLDGTPTAVGRVRDYLKILGDGDVATDGSMMAARSAGASFRVGAARESLVGAMR